MTPVTPFSNDLSAVDRSALSDNLSVLIEAGVGLVHVAGSTGELASLAPDEWATVVETAVAAAGETLVVVGVGHEYPVATELARRRRQLGASGALAMPCMQHSAGSVGFTSRLGNFAPKVPLGLHAALQKDDSAAAVELIDNWRPLEEIRAQNQNAANVAAVKTAMDAVGLAGGRVRPPLVNVDDATAGAVTVLARRMTTGGAA
ncbi:MAG: dihydrodipicolinate synthase family protein [Acidimicrobiia bacterium]